MSPSKRVPSDIPVGSQFTPDLFDLPAFVRTLVANSGNKAALKAAVWADEVRVKTVKREPTHRRGSLPLEAAEGYGLLERKTYVATPLARKLASLNPPEIYDEFARHILLNCRGLRVVDGLQQMIADRLPMSGDDIARYLTSQGIRVTVHNGAINAIRMWLSRAGLFPEDGRDPNAWTPDPEVKQRLLGLSDDSIAILAGLSEEERAFVLALCQINPQDWYPANDVRDLAEATKHVQLTRGNSREYLEPLKAAGILDFKSGGTAAGKSALLKTSDKFNRDILQVFITTTARDMDSAVAAYFKKNPQEIYADLDSDNAFRKGQALEAYAILIMRLLGLRFLHWRKRARSTGNAEVDAVFTGVIGVVPTRWQVQCKNIPSGKVDVEDAAKEVGLIPVTQATHVMIVANGAISRPAREYAREVMYRSSVTIFLLDKQDFAEVRQSPGRLGGILRSQALGIVRQQPPESLFGK